MMVDNINPNELYNLCYNRGAEHTKESFDAVRQWLNANKLNKELFNEVANFANNDNITPLHAIFLTSHPPFDLVEALVQNAPETLQLKDNHGRLPVHIACTRGGASPVIIKTMVEAYKTCVQVADRNGSLPLHVACKSGASLEVLNLLTQAYPESIDVQDNYDSKPSYWLKLLLLCQGGNDKMFLLHKSVTGGFSAPLVKLLLKAFPERCVTQDENGMTPLHLACARKTPDSIHIAFDLVNACLESSTIKDHHGRTPSQLLKQMASRRDSNGMLLLHHHSAQGVLTANSLSLLFDAYPESIALPDKKGMLPFHHACLNKVSSLDVLKLFITLYPESVLSIKDIKSDITEIKLQVTKIQSDMIKVQSNMAKMTLEITEMKSDMTKVKSNMAIATCEIKEMKSEISSIKSDVAEIKTMLRALLGIK